MGSQMIQIIILAAIALFLILRLRNVLGTREGFEKPPEVAGPVPPRARDRSFEVIEGGSADPDIADFADPDSPSGEALAAMKRVDHAFSVAEFSHGARSAYEMIVMAYENGDLDSLRQFLSPEVFGPFAEAIEARKAKGLTVEATPHVAAQFWICRYCQFGSVHDLFRHQPGINSSYGNISQDQPHYIRCIDRIIWRAFRYRCHQ
jgi:predicted lipid-binding transport protein (Tim44 family)